MRVFAEDGRSLYITRDIAAGLQRTEEFKAARILHVVDLAQTLYFRQLKGIFAKLKHPAAESITHVSYGRVPGMSTRKGSLVGLLSFLDEAKERALQAYRSEVEKRPEQVDEDVVAEGIAIGATYFYMLSNSRQKDLQFNWDIALSFVGDSGPYVQYALARSFSVEDKAQAAGIRLPEKFDASQLQSDCVHELVLILARFQETLHNVVKELDPSILSGYLIDLAKAFSAAYRELRIVGEDPAVAAQRLVVFKATQVALARGAALLGIPCLKRM